MPLNALIPQMYRPSVALEPYGAGQERAIAMQSMQQRNALMRMQMQAAQEQQRQQAQAQQNALMGQQQAAQYLDATSPAMGPAMPFDPAQAVANKVPLDLVKYLQEIRNPKPAKPIISKPGDIARDETGAELWRNPVEEKRSATMQALIDAGIDPASPQGRQMLQDAARKVTTHAPAASATVVLPPQEKEENKKVGQYFGEQYADIQKSGLAAGQSINRLSQMKTMLQGIETGKLTPLAADVAGFARSFGINIDPKLEAKEAVNAMSNEMALQMRNPAGGAGMPGALSDKDREFLQNIVPGLAKTPGGNAMIIEARLQLAKREQVVAKMARDYRAKRGSLDEGFYEELQTYSDANPLFDKIAAPAQVKRSPQDLIRDADAILNRGR